MDNILSALPIRVRLRGMHFQLLFSCSERGEFRGRTIEPLKHKILS